MNSWPLFLLLFHEIFSVEYKVEFWREKRWYRAKSGECRMCGDNNSAVGTVSFSLHVRKNEHSPCALHQDQFYNLLSLLGEFVMHSSINVKTQLFLCSEASSITFLSPFIASYPRTAKTPHLLQTTTICKNYYGTPLHYCCFLRQQQTVIFCPCRMLVPTNCGCLPLFSEPLC